MTSNSKSNDQGGRPVPSIDDEVAASLRVLAIRMMLRKNGGELKTWPANVREQYQLMMDQQAEYEATFGRVSRNSGAIDE